MTRPTVALVTGFAKNADLATRSLAPVRALKRDGVIDRILAVTWDSAELDAFVAPLAAMAEVELVRLPQPDIDGAPYQKGVIYQIRNLEAGLDLIDEDDALVFKLRPDFIADEDFLAEKIEHFEDYCAPSGWAEMFDTAMPASPFSMKIWIPWADANQPFFYEDGAFMGLKRDIAKLASRDAEAWLDVLADKSCGWFAHVVRFAMPFRESYPIFDAYLRNFRYMPANEDYRIATLPTLLADSFFLHLLVAHAWILATSFHVDCGEAGDLSFYSNIFNAGADWSNPATLRNRPPYDHVDDWRAGQAPGGLMPCVARNFGRLIDDSWQHSLFTMPVLRDLQPGVLRALLRNTTLYRRGLLVREEQAFERQLAALYAQHWPGARDAA